LIRIVRNDGRHPEISTLADALFIKTIVKRWRKKENKSMREFAEQYRSKLIILKSFDEIDRYFNALKIDILNNTKRLWRLGFYLP